MQMKTKGQRNRFIYLAYFDEYMSQNPMYKLRLKQVVANSRPALCLSQAGILVSGILLLVSWRYLVDKFLLFEATGFGILGEIWCVVLAAAILGLSGCKLIRGDKTKQVDPHDDLPFFPRLHKKGFPAYDRPDALTWTSGAPGASGKGSFDASHPKWLSDHEGQESSWHHVSDLPIPARPSARPAAYDPPVATPVAAPALPPAVQAVPDEVIPQEVEQPQTSTVLSALEALQASQSSAEQARHLYVIAESVLANLAEVEQITKKSGGIDAILNTVKTLAIELQQPTASVEVSAATLQVSWVLLLVSKGPDATKAEWVEYRVVHHAAQLMQAVAHSQYLKVEVRSTVLRNLCWALFNLCDATALPNVHINQDLLHVHSPTAAQELMEADAISLLGSLVSMELGMEPASFAAALLALLCQMHSVAEDVSAASLRVLFRPECLQGLCFVLHNRMPDERCTTVLTSLLHYLVSCKGLTFLQALIEEHLLGSFLQIMPLDLCRLFICKLLSSGGQEVLVAVEDAFQLDVPLALAQVIPSGCHLVLPGSTTIEGEDLPPTCTCALTCRLLLLRDRLPELIAAFFEELGLDEDSEQEQDPDQDQHQDQASAQPTDQAGGSSEVVMCVMELVSFLMSQDLEIQRFKHIRGLGIDCSSSSDATTISAVSDDGCEPEQLLPFLEAEHSCRCAPGVSSTCGKCESPAANQGGGWGTGQCRGDWPCCSSSQMAPIPGPSTPGASSSAAAWASGSVPLRSSSCAGMCRRSCRRKGSDGGESTVIFDMGGGRLVEVGCVEYAKLKQASKFLRSVLIRADKNVAINVLRVPQFSDEENAWALRMLLVWTAERRIEGLEAEQARSLWQAAEFFQVDDLQAHCEDILASMLNEEAVLRSAFELGASHLSGARLLHLCTSHMMQNFGEVVASPTFKHLHHRFRAHLEARLVQEVRDRLAAICSLNGGVAFELSNMSEFEAAGLTST